MVRSRPNSSRIVAELRPESDWTAITIHPSFAVVIGMDYGRNPPQLWSRCWDASWPSFAHDPTELQIAVGFQAELDDRPAMLSCHSARRRRKLLCISISLMGAHIYRLSYYIHLCFYTRCIYIYATDQYAHVRDLFSVVRSRGMHNNWECIVSSPSLSLLWSPSNSFAVERYSHYSQLLNIVGAPASSDWGRILVELRLKSSWTTTTMYPNVMAVIGSDSVRSQIGFRVDRRWILTGSRPNYDRIITGLRSKFDWMEITTHSSIATVIGMNYGQNLAQSWLRQWNASMSQFSRDLTRLLIAAEFWPEFGDSSTMLSCHNA